MEVLVRAGMLEPDLAGVEGVVATGADGEDRIVISIDILGRSVAIKLPCAQVKAA